MDTLFTIRGKIRSGAKRGRQLGFPTANIALHKNIPEGVYISLVTLEKFTYHAATFIGSAKTFNEKDYKAESYLLDFSKQVYGKWLSIKLLKKIRENEKFSGEEELLVQMKKDVEHVKQFFQK